MHWKDWCGSWNSNTLATWCKELIHLKIPWCWARLKVGGEGDDRGWDGWMASLTRWTWVWARSGSWWWTAKPGVLQSMGLQSWTQLSDWTELTVKMDWCVFIISPSVLKWIPCFVSFFSCFLKNYFSLVAWTEQPGYCGFMLSFWVLAEMESYCLKCTRFKGTRERLHAQA